MKKVAAGATEAAVSTEEKTEVRSIALPDHFAHRYHLLFI
jgi:hypothetical protein